MQLEEIAQTILFGDRWEDKLAGAGEFPNELPKDFNDEPRKSAFVELPRFPGRPPRLARIGKAEFPKLDSLNEDSARGRLLHFFANHELLAMELMALMLLKFPEAPKAFRSGVARTIFEEQNHLRLYVDRMRELGVDFGDLPVSDYFWAAMKDMRSPLDFVTQMSLTLEQANLDFSLFYQQAVASRGDVKTAAVLERVYREEIGHVKHGLTWFNRWRESEASGNTKEDDWDAYVRLLPEPMTPRRAKGLSFSAESRRLAGFSERYIHELEVYGGSKGRPPVFWLFNPFCDAEIARGKPGLTLSEPVRRMGLDLETLPMFLALDTDVVLVDELPRTQWLREMQVLGFKTPEFRKLGKFGEMPRENKIAGFEPWGWSPDSYARFGHWKHRLVTADGANNRWCGKFLDHENFDETQIGRLFSKTWSAAYLRSWLEKNPDDQAIFGELESVGTAHEHWAAAKEYLLGALSCGENLVVKAPWGTSGTQNKRVLHQRELENETPLSGWIRNTLQVQGSVIVERWLDKEIDLSVQIEVLDEKVLVLGVRRFVNGTRSEYRGTHLDPKLGTVSPEIMRFLHGAGAPLERFRKFAYALGVTLREQGYQGPAGLDALVWRDSNGRLFLKPLVELNPRWTMGRVALELEPHVLPGVPAVWTFVSVKELASMQKLRENHPPRMESAGSGLRLSEGVIFTTDPEKAREVLTMLIAGEKALAAQNKVCLANC